MGKCSAPHNVLHIERRMEGPAKNRWGKEWSTSILIATTPDPEFPPLEEGKPVKLDAPIAELLIRENGTVKSARLIRSSNVGAWDQVFLTTMQKWKFSKAPGCGIRKTTVSIDI